MKKKKMSSASIPNLTQFRIQIQPFGTYNKEIEAVVIEAEPEQSDRVAVGALAGPPLPRRSEIDTNIYHYNTNYNFNPL